MKLSGAAATAYFAKPDPAATGVLIFGQDAMRVALRRQELIAALIGRLWPRRAQPIDLPDR